MDLLVLVAHGGHYSGSGGGRMDQHWRGEG